MSETIFHKIIRGEIPADIVFQDEDMIVIKDIQPAGPAHLLVIPKKTIANAAAVKSEDDALIGRMVRKACELAPQAGATNGFRLVFNAGPDGGQSVDQLHLHVIGGRPLRWPPG